LIKRKKEEIAIPKIKGQTTQTIHVFEDWYLTADKFQFILFRLTKTKTGKNIGKYYATDFRFYPTLEDILLYLQRRNLWDKLEKGDAKTLIEMRNILVETKELFSKILKEKLYKIKKG